MRLTFSYHPDGVPMRGGGMTGPAMSGKGTHDGEPFVSVAVLDSGLKLDRALEKARDECRNAALELVRNTRRS